MQNWAGYVWYWLGCYQTGGKAVSCQRSVPEAGEKPDGMCGHLDLIRTIMIPFEIDFRLICLHTVGICLLHNEGFLRSVYQP